MNSKDNGVPVDEVRRAREMVLPESFLEELAAVESDRVYDAIFNMLESVEEFPLLGSAIVPNSVRERYGDKARKIVVASFDIFYTYNDESQTVEIKALVHQRGIR